MINDILLGLTAGLIATLSMSIFMALAFFLLPRQEQYPLPPKEITEEIAEKVALRKILSNAQINILSLFAHFSYGGMMGIIYFLIFNPSSPFYLFIGIFFGLCVWSISYLLALPALNILTSAINHPIHRNILMIFAHITWGGTLSLAGHWLTA